MSPTEWRKEALALMATADEAVVTDLMQGAIDLHIHSGPSTMARQLDHLEQVEQAAAAGMAGVLQGPPLFGRADDPDDAADRRRQTASRCTAACDEQLDRRVQPLCG